MIDFTRLQTNFTVLRSNKAFELFVVIVIISSALLVGAKTYELSPLAMSLVVWLDRFITFFFLVEIAIRFLGEENKKDFFRNPWNIFDTLIVTISLIPIDNTDMALVARLVRVFRVLRMVSVIPELRLLLNSLVKAMPQLGYVILLMFIIFYIYAAIGSTLFENINQDLWGDITISLLTLFRVMTFEDWTDVMYETMGVYPLSWIYYLTFIFFTAFAFLNMVIGIVVNVLDEEHAKVRKQAAIDAHEPTIADLQEQLVQIRALLEKQQGPK
ncbi:ion transporter [uncultured Amphritea sp.]|uniref:ion transporter n=1 Tax=Amphritea sp. TaxID=1872502 RepID=UPI0025D1B0F3|nr:ion transporter [uncultured Amphritea sp.]